MFDVVNFYPSIMLEILLEAINWAKQHVEIFEEDKDIIVETKKSLLYMNNECWTKKGDNFDVDQGALDSAEVCDLVGIFLISKLQEPEIKANAGIFRDDGLAVTSLPPRQAEKTKKKICEIPGVPK